MMCEHIIQTMFKLETLIYRKDPSKIHLSCDM